MLQWFTNDTEEFSPVHDITVKNSEKKCKLAFSSIPIEFHNNIRQIISVRRDFK